MPHIVDTGKYLDTAVSLLREGKTDIPVPIEGESMRPFLKKGDTVYLSPLHGMPKRGDIVLFMRPNGSYVLHRVAKAEKNGIVMMLGDNQLATEPVPKDKLLAEAASAMRNGKLINKKSLVWFFYSSIFLRLAPIRHHIARFIK